MHECLIKTTKAFRQGNLFYSEGQGGLACSLMKGKWKLADEEQEEIFFACLLCEA